MISLNLHTLYRNLTISHLSIIIKRGDLIEIFVKIQQTPLKKKQHTLLMIDCKANIIRIMDNNQSQGKYNKNHG